MELSRPQPVVPVPERVRTWIEWIGVGRVVATAGSFLIIAAGCWWLLHAPPPPIERSLPYAATASSAAGSVTTLGARPAGPTAAVSTTAPTAAPPSPTIIVQVAGAVLRPGVYLLPAGARVHQVIDAAGGAGAQGDPGALNLAVALADGDRVYVPQLGETTEPPVVAANAGSSSVGGAVPGAGAPGPTGPIDLNRATAVELDALPGVGPATASAIVAHRDEHGPFGSVDDLLDVRGIGPAKLDAIRPMVTV